MSTPLTGCELFQQFEKDYEESDSALVTNMRSTFINCIIPVFGGPQKQGKRASKVEIDKAMTFLQTVSLEQIAALPEILDSLMTKLNIPKKKQRKYRSYFKKFWEWLSAKGYVEVEPEDQEEEETTEFTPYLFRQKNPDIIPPKVGRDQKPHYALGTQEGDFINESLKQQLEELRKYGLKDLKLKGNNYSSLDSYMLHVRRILGWLHREKEVPLEDLSIYSLVPFCPIYLNRGDYEDRLAYLDALDFAKEEAKQKAKETVKLVKEFMNFYSENIYSQQDIIKAFIFAAKFVYADETDEDEADDFNDVTVLRKLRRLLRENIKQVESDQKPMAKVVGGKIKIVPWEKVLFTLKKMQEQADQDKTYFPHSAYRSGYKVNPRKEMGTVRSLQQFLIASLLILLPPDRQQSCRDMKINTNLFKGVLEGENLKICDDWHDAPPEASWFLYSGDFKTDKSYGEFLGRLPNFQLGESCLYDYLELWLSKYRPLVLRKHEDPGYVFIGVRSRKQLSKVYINKFLKRQFQEHAGVALRAHQLRHCYQTHLLQAEAPEKVRDAALVWMKQSAEARDRYYICQSQLDKTEPVLEYNQQLVERLWDSL